MSGSWTLLSVRKMIAMEKGILCRFSNEDERHLHGGHHYKLIIKRLLTAGTKAATSTSFYFFAFPRFRSPLAPRPPSSRPRAEGLGVGALGHLSLSIGERMIERGGVAQTVSLSE